MSGTKGHESLFITRLILDILAGGEHFAILDFFAKLMSQKFADLLLALPEVVNPNR